MGELAAFLGIAVLLLRRPRIRRSLDAFTGTCLVAFGIRLAAER